jgi:molybdopterin-guanine dinucleotide biosynthesis protein A
MAAIVAVLAGGAGTRIGGEKAISVLAGRPLISYPLQAARAAGLETVVVAKAVTRLPELRVPILIEPEDLPQHPLSGIVTALRSHPVIVAVPCDMPFLTAGLLGALADAGGALVTAAPGHPFPGLYSSTLLGRLERALSSQVSMRSILADAGAQAVPDVDRAVLFSVNSRADLAEAELRLAAQSWR